MAIVFSASTLKAQLTGIKTIPGDYASISAFVTDANSVGIGAGGVVVNVAAGHTETSTAVIALTATGTAANPIVIQKSGAGANPIITSYTGGVGTPGTAVQDGVFALVGSDYVTIDGVDVTENAANTTNPSTMEYGYAMFKASAIDGCQFNIIRNCNVSLSNINNGTGSGPSFDGSRGINLTNALISAQATTVTVTAASGSNSNNQIYSNTISNVNIGISLAGFAAASPFTLGDTGNDVGGASALTGNTIVNFGGAASATNPAAGIRTVNQWSPNISYNTINNNTGAGSNHVSTLRGVLIGAATSANTTVNNNIITMQSGAATSLLEGISNSSGATAASNTINISNNLVSLAYSTATTGSATGIASVSSAANVNIIGNTVTSVLSLPAAQNVIAGTGTLIGINGGSPSTSLAVNNNVIQNFARTSIAGGTTRGIVLGTSPTQTASGNTIENIAYVTPSSTGGIDGIYSLSSAVAVNITNNIVRNLSTPTTGTITGIRENTVAGTKTITGNQIYGFATTSGGAGGASFNGIFTSVGTVTVQNNTIYNLVSTGTTGGTAGAISGISTSGGTTTTISTNKIYDLASNSTNPTVNGILISGGTTVNAINNLIGDVRTPFANAANPLNGINVTGSTTTNVYYNTIRLTASSAGANFGSSAISAATSANLSLNNNIFVNSSSANGTGLAVAYRRSSATLTTYQGASNRNDFVASTIYTDGTTPIATLAAYQAAMAPRDANSISEVPNFINTTGSNANFLHINTALPSGIESGGVNIAGITTDFDNEIRQGNGGYGGTGTAPDMGADEFETAIVNCSAANGGTISPATNTNCEGTTRTITSVGVSNEFGNSYQWKISTTAGGPYVNVTGGTGATTASYTTAALTPGTYYYLLETTCSFGSLTGLSNEYTLVVNPTPLVAVTPSSATYCNPGTAVSLTASGATSFAWSPATGLSAITGATVNASPSGTTTYTVLGSALGCPSLPVNVTVTVVNAPIISSITATPAAVCIGEDAQLQVNATLAYNQTASVYSFAGSTGTYTAITGTNLTTASQDDSGIGNLDIGFTFPYNGNTFTKFGARTNGLIELGQTTVAITGFSANSLATTANCIAPLWDDNNMTGGVITYSTTGTAPNRVLTVQWTGMHVGSIGSTTSPTIDCQAILHETTGVIELVYGSTSAALTVGASIGISGATGNYLSVTPLAPASASTVSSTVENSTISSEVNYPTGTIYTFTPPVAPVLTYAWSPATYLSSTSIANPVASAVITAETYSVLVSAPNGCAATGNVTLTTNPLPTAPTATNSAQCGAAIPTASVVSTSGLPTPSFIWYDAATAGTALQTSTSTTYTTAISSTTTFYVAELNTVTGCESARTAVTVTVATADDITASVDFATICIGASVNLSVVNDNPTPLQSYTYTWTNADAGSGLVSQTGSNITITPTQAGTYTYDVAGIDGGCSALSSVLVTVNPYTATVTPVNVTCNAANNGTFTLATESCGTASSYSVDGGAFGPIPTNLTPGSHTVVVQNTLGFQSTLQSISITEPAAIQAPLGISNVVICQGVTSATLVVPVSAALSTTATFGLAGQPAVIGTSTIPTTTTLNPNVIATATLPALPAGAVVTSVNYTMNNLTPLGGSWANDVYFAFSGAYAANYQNGTGAPGSTTPFNFTRAYSGTYAPAGGTVSLHYYDRYDDNAGVECTFPTGTSVGSLVINYTVTNATATNWYDAASAGVLQGTGTPFQTVGTALLPTTNTPGVYTFFAEGTNGTCVSATRTPVTVTVNGTSSSTTNITACGSYTWTNGTTYNSSGSFTQTLVNTLGCDSIATLNLTINPIATGTDVQAACGSYTWINGTTYMASNSTATHTIVGGAANGCDSIVTLNLTINPIATGTDVQTACVSYTWINNVTYTTSNNTATHTIVGGAANGCDSIVTLNLTINQPTTGVDVQTACVSYTWINNVTYTASNNTATHTIVGGAANGCDSIVTLNLTINQPTTGVDVQTACVSYTWINNVTYTASNNTATHTIVGGAANGCDSTVTLNLTINQPTTGVDVQTACVSYTWINNVTYTASNSTATHTIVGGAANGCDSTVTLNLTINQPTTGVDVQTACVSYTWINNVTYTTSNNTATHTIVGGAANGCDSIVTLNLTINQPTTGVDVQAACDSYTWINNVTYTASNSTATHTIVGGAANGCDSIVTLNLTITVTPVATATDNGDATITASAGATYEWIDCATGNSISGANTQTFSPAVNGSYSVVVSNGTCDDTSSCVVIDYIGIKELTNVEIQLMPNPTRDFVTIQMSISSATLEVRDAQGKMIIEKVINSGEQVDLSTVSTGVYFFTIKTTNGSIMKRVVKN